jgi:hypothetical protein
MKETTSKDHTFSLTVTNDLYKKLKHEHDPVTTINPIASYAVIGRILEVIEKRLKSVSMDTKKGK